MSYHHYAIDFEPDGFTISKVAVIDDEAEAWENESGKFEPFGHQDPGCYPTWIYLGPADNPVASTGWRASLSGSEWSFTPPDPEP